MDQIVSFLSLQLGLTRDNSLILIGAIIGFLFGIILKRRPKRTSANQVDPALGNFSSSISKMSSITSGAITVNGNTVPLDTEQWNEIKDMLRNKDKIAAIKKIREILQLDLASAKALAEMLEAQIL